MESIRIRPPTIRNVFQRDKVSPRINRAHTLPGMPARKIRL